jgi:hypothetical protein
MSEPAGKKSPSARGPIARKVIEVPGQVAHVTPTSDLAACIVSHYPRQTPNIEPASQTPNAACASRVAAVSRGLWLASDA